jgi:3-deoxy-manno-octulosonate cytidylyltransferase (CMP-KDO synthetase)
MMYQRVMNHQNSLWGFSGEMRDSHGSASLPPCYGFIPARYASARFPGKPLADILGKPMFWHVWFRASRCGMLRSVTVCTDDARIMDSAAALGVPCVMTGEDHASGTDRIHEAASAMALPDDAVIVNIQGDEPALEPAMLEDLLAPFGDPLVRTATLAHPVDAAEAASPDHVKVVCDRQGNALYFSRAPIPFPREGDGGGQPYLLHVGIYAYRLDVLARYTRLAQTPLEQREKLEQLRLLENGIPMRVSLTRHRSAGVDRPEDLAAVIALLTRTA